MPTSKVEMIVYDNAANCPVVQIPGRKFPGVVIQGDSLKVMSDLVSEIARCLSSGDIDEAKGVTEELANSLSARLEVYEHALKTSGILGTPY